jgi:hypothetical protein
MSSDNQSPLTGFGLMIADYVRISPNHAIIFRLTIPEFCRHMPVLAVFRETTNHKII